MSTLTDNNFQATIQRQGSYLARATPGDNGALTVTPMRTSDLARLGYVHRSVVAQANHQAFHEVASDLEAQMAPIVMQNNQMHAQLHNADHRITELTSKLQNAQSELDVRASHLNDQNHQIQAMKQAIAEGQKANECLKIEVRRRSFPGSLYQGACGHFWVPSPTRMCEPACPTCQELQTAQDEVMQVNAIRKDLRTALGVGEHLATVLTDALGADFRHLTRDSVRNLGKSGQIAPATYLVWCAWKGLDNVARGAAE